MRLDRHARENYELQIATTASDGDPIAAGEWEASFDGGENFVAATVITHDTEDWSAWLLAGPDAEVGTSVAVLSRSMRPLVRAVDNPEIIVRDAPRVVLH